MNVFNSDFSEIGRVGVLYKGYGVRGTFEGNTYTGKGDGDWLDYALDISKGADIVVNDNVVTDNRGVADVDGSTSACVMVTTYWCAAENKACETKAQITDNRLEDCTAGVAIGYDDKDTSHVELTGNTLILNDDALEFTGPGATGFANRNAIVDNVKGGIVGLDDFTTTFDATCNWWGDPFGQSGDGPGGGDPVSGDVDFDPWLVSDDLGGVCDGSGTPQSLKKQAKALLSSLVPDNIFTSAQSGAIDKAIVSIDKSLDTSLWETESTLNSANGKTVFNEERNAVVMLSKPFVKDIPGISQVIDALVRADESLAETAIADATNEANKSKAEEFMAKADSALEKGNPENAINMYRQAWMVVTRKKRRL